MREDREELNEIVKRDHPGWRLRGGDVIDAVLNERQAVVNYLRPLDPWLAMQIENKKHLEETTDEEIQI